MSERRRRKWDVVDPSVLEKVEAPVSGPHATVPINHCPPPVRALLISPSFHERVGKETDTRVQLRGEYNGTPPLSLLVTADTDEAVRAAEARIVEAMNPRRKTPPPSTLEDRVDVSWAHEADAGFGLSLRITGQGGQFLRHIERTQGVVRVQLAGIPPNGMHVLIVAINQSGLDKAKELVVDLLAHVRKQLDDYKAQKDAQAHAAYAAYYPQSAYYATNGPGQAPASIQPAQPVHPTQSPATPQAVPAQTDASAYTSPAYAMGYDAASYGSAAGYDANAAYYSYAYAGYPYGYDYSQYAQAVPQAAQGSEQANKYREKTEVDPLLAGIQEVNVADELRKAQTAPPASMKRTFAQFVGAEAEEVDMDQETPPKKARTEEHTASVNSTPPIKLVDYADDEKLTAPSQPFWAAPPPPPPLRAANLSAALDAASASAPRPPTSEIAPSSSSSGARSNEELDALRKRALGLL